jgi:hypothetical protein
VIAAFGLDGVERARFVVGAPRSTGGFGVTAGVHSSAAPGRVIVEFPNGPAEPFDRVLHHHSQVAVLDIPGASVLPLRLGNTASPLRLSPSDAVNVPASCPVAPLWRSRHAGYERAMVGTSTVDLAEAWLVDLGTLAVRHLSDATLGSPLYSIALSADGQLVAVGMAAGLRIGPFALKAPLSGLATRGPVTHLAFAPDGSTLAYVVANGVTETMECWLLDVAQQHARLVASVAGRDSGRAPLFVTDRLIAFSVGGAIVLGDAPTGDFVIHQVGEAACATTASPGGEVLLCRARTQQWFDEPDPVTGAIVSDAWYRLGVATGTLERLGVNTGTWEQEPPTHAPWQLFLEDSADELPMAFVAVELATGRQQRFLPGEATQLFGQVEVIGETPGGSSAFFAVEVGEETTVWRADYATGISALVARDYGDTPWGMFSPDGQFLAIQAFDEKSYTPPNRTPLAVFTSEGEEVLRIDGVALLGWVPAG